MNENYELAKYAALEDLAEMIDNGADLEDCLIEIDRTLSSPFEKTASLEDQQARLGIESACYEFLKEASEYCAHYEINDLEEAALDVFEKTAAAYGHKPSMREQAASKFKRMKRDAKVSARKFLRENPRAATAGKIGAGVGAAGAAAGLGYMGYKKLKQKREEQGK